jgi:hypothetical protein
MKMLSRIVSSNLSPIESTGCAKVSGTLKNGFKKSLYFIRIKGTCRSKHIGWYKISLSSKKSRRSYDQFTNGGNFGKPFLSVPEIFAQPVFQGNLNLYCNIGT